MRLHLIRPTRVILAFTLFSLPSVEFGGWFLLNYGIGAIPAEILTAAGHDLARGGHGHAGLFLILAILCLALVDATCLHPGWKWVVRLTPGTAALLVSAGMFALAFHPTPALAAERWLVLAGGLLMAVALITLGIGLAMTPNDSQAANR